MIVLSPWQMSSTLCCYVLSVTCTLSLWSVSYWSRASWGVNHVSCGSLWLNAQGISDLVYCMIKKKKKKKTWRGTHLLYPTVQTKEESSYSDTVSPETGVTTTYSSNQPQLWLFLNKTKQNKQTKKAFIRGCNLALVIRCWFIFFYTSVTYVLMSL